MSREISVFVHDSAGLGLTGLTLIWANTSTAIYNAVSGAALTGVTTPVRPTFSETGLGFYKFTRPEGYDTCGLIDCTTAANPRYWVYRAQSLVTFAAFDVDGAPLAGLSPAFVASEPKVVSTGSYYGSQPSVTALGNGLYKFTGVTATHLVGRVDMGATAYPRYFPYDSEVASPVVIRRGL